MSKRNLVWILAVILLIMLFWQMPDAANRKDTYYQTFLPLADISTQVKKNYVESVDDQKLLEGAIQGMLQKLDPFSRYIPPGELATFDNQTTGTIQGIGIFPEERSEFLTVLSPLEDSPAFKAGILPGDQIMRINGEPTKNMTWEDAAKLLTGDVGTKVTLEVRHELTGVVEPITLVREMIHVYSVKGYIRNRDGEWDYMIDPKNKIGYIRITSFLTNTADELDKAYTRLVEEGVQAVILDLRFDPGGLLDTAVKVADRFLDEGPIVSTKGKFQEEVVWSATNENTYVPIPVAVLINSYTASAAEIVSGALKDHKRATVIGVRSYGKGSVQKLISLENGYGAIKLTTAYYYLPNGQNIHRRPGDKKWGVDPDIIVPIGVEDQLAIKESRAKADVFWGKLPETMSCDSKMMDKCKPVPLMIDKQLKKAIDVLVGELSKKSTTQPATQATQSSETRATKNE
jgi:carboxyl-terminal processing protease